MVDVVVEEGDVRLSDDGTVHTVVVTEDGAVVDISTATEMLIYFEKPSGSVFSKTATHTTDGTDGKMKCTTAAAELDELGEGWKIQGRVTTPEGKWGTAIGCFKVEGNLYAS